VAVWDPLAIAELDRQRGDVSKYATEFTFGGLTLSFYTRWSPSPH